LHVGGAAVVDITWWHPPSTASSFISREETLVLQEAKKERAERAVKSKGTKYRQKQFDTTGEAVHQFLNRVELFHTQILQAT